jgi:AraC family transcriptional regulator
MDSTVEMAIGRTIEMMWDRLGDQITVDDMARTARFSKFHFSRLFRGTTGVTPGRFLTAVRLQRAKHLLARTRLSVAEVGRHVGYASVGTFSSRFTASVGVSPSVYRRLGGTVPRIQVNSGGCEPRSTVVLRGRVTAADPVPAGPIFVGVFPDRLPAGRPVAYTVLSRPGAFAVHRVPPCTWHLYAHVAPFGHVADPPDRARGPAVYIGCAGPVEVATDGVHGAPDIALRPIGIFDPPVLLPAVTQSPGG